MDGAEDGIPRCELNLSAPEPLSLAISFKSYSFARLVGIGLLLIPGAAPLIYFLNCYNVLSPDMPFNGYELSPFQY